MGIIWGNRKPPSSVEVISIAGGGGGGGGAGGGAGGVLIDKNFKLSVGKTYTINVGAGGSANTTASGSSGSSSYIEEISNYSVVFDGTGDYLILSANSAWAFGTGDFTIEFWMYYQGGNGNLITNRHIDAGGGAEGPGTWGVRLTPTSIGILEVITGGTTVSGTVTSSQITNVWSHVAITRTSNTAYVFLNGTLLNSGSMAVNFNSSAYQLQIGREANYNIYYTGYFSNIRIVKGTAVYTANFTPSTSPLTAISGTSLLTCQSSTFKDNSTNNFAITVNGDSSVSLFVPSSTVNNDSNLYSTVFDGNGDYLSIPTTNTAMHQAGNWTYEVWLYFNALPTTGYQNIFGQGASGQNSFGLYSANAGSNNWAAPHRFKINQANVGDVIVGTSSVSLNTWYHVAVVRNSGVVTLYVNGVAEGTYSNSSDYTFGNNPLLIGNNFNGYISNFRFAKGSALYTGNFTPSTTPLTAITNTSLLTCQSSTFKDNSTNNFAITVTGNPSNVAAIPINSDMYGVYFDGTGDYLSSTITSTTIGTNDFTVECWVYPTAAYGSLSRMFKFGPSSFPGYLTFFINSSGQVTYGPAGSATITTTNSVPLNAWTHIAISKQGGTSKVFLNGTVSGTASDTNNFLDTTTFFLGQDGSSNYWTGYISNFRLVNGTGIYTSNFTPSTSPLTAVAGTVLLTCQSSNFVDNSSNNFTITAFGNTVAQKIYPFSTTNDRNSCSVYFDGTGDYLSTLSDPAFSFGTGDFTIEAWVYLFANSTGTIFDNRTSTTSLHPVFGFATGKVYLYVAGVGYMNTAVNTNTWLHLALVKNSNVTKIYINGVAAPTSYTDTNNYEVSGVVNIGGGYGNVNYLTGYISNLRVMKGFAVYTANFTPSTSPLTAVSGTSLLTCQNAFIKDNSTNNFSITINGNAVVSSQNPYPLPSTLTVDDSLSSVYFDGTGDYITASSTTAFTFSTNNFTIEAWVWLLPGTATGCVFECRTELTSLHPFFGFTTGPNIYLYVAGANVLSSPVTAGVWNHLALVRSAGVTKIYVNGIASASSYTDTNNYSAATTGYIGGGWNASNMLNGYISNLRVVNGTAIYTSNFTPSTSPLTAITNTVLLTCQTTAIKDNSINNFTLTRNGNATVKSVSPFVSPTARSYSAYFDGTGDYLTLANNSALDQNVAFTIECWVYPTQTSSRYIWSQLSSGYLGLTHSSNSFQVDKSSVGIQLTSSANFPPNFWYHVSLCFDGTTTRLFVNGLLQGSFAGGGSASGATFTIGGYLTFSAEFYGYISNFRFIKGTALYTSNFTPSTSPLTAITNTSLLTLQNNSFKDNSANNFTLTGNGNVIPSIANPFDIAVRPAGGGGGGSYNGGATTAGAAGGSGGGAPLAGGGQGKSPGTGVSGQGFSGGAGWAQDSVGSGGGGGGAGGVGGAAGSNVGGNGGMGAQPSINDNGYSVYFDGTGDYLSIAANSAFEFTGSYTIECWVYFNNLTGTQDIIGNYVASTAADWTLLMSSSTFQFYPSSAASYVSSPTIVINKWYHVAAVRNGSTCSLYVDGVSVGTPLSFSGTLGSASKTVYVGTRTATGNYLNGYVSNARIVKGTALYTTNFTPSTTPLTAISGTNIVTSLLTCQNASIKDNGSYNYTITVSGDASVRRLGPFNPLGINSYSVYFDGTGDYLTAPESSAFNFNSNNDYTLEAWVYPTTVSAVTAVMTYNNGSVNNGNYQWGLYRDTNRWKAWITYGSAVSSAVEVFSPAGSAIANVWQHVAVVRQGTTLTIYVNGVNSGSGSLVGITPNALTTPTLKIGTASWAGSDFNGYISNLRIVKGTALYTANFTPSTTPLTAITNTSLLTCQSSTIVDNSTNNFSITTYGNSLVSTTHPFLQNSYYAGGGGGSSSSGTQGSGGLGGGGSGVTGLNNGTANTGGGGGSGGSGGSGTVIMRYPSNFRDPVDVTGSYEVITIEGYKTYRWTSSGSIKF